MFQYILASGIGKSHLDVITICESLWYYEIFNFSKKKLDHFASVARQHPFCSILVPSKKWLSTYYYIFLYQKIE